MKLIMRKAFVRWKGGSKGGSRVITTESGVLKQSRYSVGIPFCTDSVTNPVELMAAALAGSFSLALSNELGLAAFSAGDTLTTATLTLERLAAGWTIMNIH